MPVGRLANLSNQAQFDSLPRNLGPGWLIVPWGAAFRAPTEAMVGPM